MVITDERTHNQTRAQVRARGELPPQRRGPGRAQGRGAGAGRGRHLYLYLRCAVLVDGGVGVSG